MTGGDGEWRLQSHGAVPGPLSARPSTCTGDACAIKHLSPRDALS